MADHHGRSVDSGRELREDERPDVVASHLRELYEAEQQRRRRAEAQVEQLRGEVEYFKERVALREHEVRYRLGDALVRAAKPSMETLKLPFRVASLLAEGIRKSRARRRHDREAAAPSARRETPGGSAAVAVLVRPFSIVPRGLRRRDDLCVAAVTDEFSWWAWQFETEAYTFRPERWREALEKRRPHLLLIESAWKGIEDSWYFQIRNLGSRREVSYVLPDVVAWCRRRGIPTVFYNKEDPPNFGVFVDAATAFDFVFTSDANCTAGYRERAGHDRAFALPFAAQPRIHNPIMDGVERTGSVCFAGTWYNHRHLGRKEDAVNILRPALDFGLHIFDRMAGSRNQSYRWPDEFAPAVRGSLPYSKMLATYKRYKVFLNVNSVRNSPTMFSRRVFELLACGTPVISSYSEGIEELLGTDLVLLSDDEGTTRRLLERVLGDDDYRERLALRGQRKVFSEHTYTHRLQSILDAIGLERPAVGRPVLTMIAAVEDADQVAGAWQNYRRQTYENKRLVLCAARAAAVAHADHITNRDESVRVVVRQGVAWEGTFLDAMKAGAEGFVTALSPTHYYGPHYLTDYAHATFFVTQDVIGKACFYVADDGAAPTVVGRGSEYRTADHVNPWTLCLPRGRAVQAACKLRSARTPGEWWRLLERQFDRKYAADRFNYVQGGDGGSGPREPSAPGARFAGSDSRGLQAALV